MQQLESALYQVEPGEEVTVVVQAIKVANFDTYRVDGALKTPVSNNPRTYQFTVTKPPGLSHRTTLNYFFPEVAPDDAEYRSFVSGDKGGGTFNGPAIQKIDQVDHCDITFRCD